MARWVALLRGVNVSGAGKLPMAEFRAMLSGLGFGAVQSYISPAMRFSTAIWRRRCWSG